MKRLLKFWVPAVAALLVMGCNCLKTSTYENQVKVPLNTECPDSIDVQVSVEYPVKGAPEEVLKTMTASILTFVFDLETDPEGVAATTDAYVKGRVDDYHNSLDDLWEEVKNNPDIGSQSMFSWYDYTNGYFTGRYRNFLSYIVECESYEGGAHGVISLAPVVLDRKTGLQVSEEEFFVDDYQDALAGALRDHLPEALDNDPDALDSVFEKDILPNGSFEVGKDGVTYYYQPYEIGPYMLGVIAVNIPWKEIEHLVRNKP